MKQIILSLSFFLLATVALAQANTPVYTGLVSGLVDIKYSTEAFLVAMMQNADTENERTKALRNYNTMRVLTDQIIYQMAADMRAKNSVKLFRQLNRYYKSHALSDNGQAGKCFSAYTTALADAYSFYRSQIHPEPGSKTVIPVETILTQGWTMLKGFNEMQAQRVNGILEVLNNLRLSSPNDLLKSTGIE
jgi:hypothetical protein